MSYQQSIADLSRSLASHPVFDTEYFTAICDYSWNKDGYAVHRANFFDRTALTVPAIATVCARAAEAGDQYTLTFFSYILSEESGNGDPERSHPLLMETSHNLFGENVFGLEPLRVCEAKDSALIVQGTRQYKARLRRLCNGSYQRLLGTAMALELHAEHMLSHCRTAFRAHAARCRTSEFGRDIEVYFNVHLNGVEARHAADARKCVEINCKTDGDVAELTAGAEETLAAQMEMWRDLHEKMKTIGGYYV